MKIADDKEGYLKIIDSIIIGPDIVNINGFPYAPRGVEASLSFLFL